MVRNNKTIKKPIRILKPTRSSEKIRTTQAKTEIAPNKFAESMQQ